MNAAEALAGTTVRDVLIGVRSLDFLKHPPSGSLDLALIYQPGLAVSEQEKTALVDAAGSGIKTETLTVHLVPVSVSDLARIEKFHFVLLTSGLQSHFQTIFERTKGKSILTMSADLDCVRSGRCVMGVVSQPLVRVLVNHAASEDAVVMFDESFRMMITEF
ncbi:MAG: YfiR/HmsC family protein [Rhodospirillaceae bacterium]